jgi:Fe-S-cluster containining protein
MIAMATRYDCTSCGACCVNPDDNRAEGYRFYLEVRDTKLLQKPELMKKLVIYDPDGVPHLRLDPQTHRCVALGGKIGQRVRCTIYELRPKGCRMLEPGDVRCIQARLERGIT